MSPFFLAGRLIMPTDWPCATHTDPTMRLPSETDEQYKERLIRKHTTPPGSLLCGDAEGEKVP